MKNKIYMLVLLVGFFMVGCVDEIDDKFDQSADERLDSALKEYSDILTGAPKGWLMEYYAGGEESEDVLVGGYNLICSFEKGSVTIYSELAEGKSVTSLYSLISERGPMITFDTYNELLHIFSDPVEGAGPPSGYAGDFEFVFVEVSSDRIVLKGKKRENTVILKKLDEDVVWEDYLAAINAIKASVLHWNFPRYNILKGETSVGDLFISNENKMQIFASGKEKTAQNILYTVDGFKVYKPIVIDGVEYEQFKIDTAKHVITSTGSDGKEIKMEGYKPEGYIEYGYYLGNYRTTYTDYNGNNQSLTSCGVVQHKFNESYTVSSLSRLTGINMVMRYDRFDGRVYFASDYCGTLDLDIPYHIHQEMWLGGFNVDFSNRYRYYGTSDMAETSPTLTFASNIEESKHIGIILIIKLDDGSLGLVDYVTFYTDLVMKKR